MTNTKTRKTVVNVGVDVGKASLDVFIYEKDLWRINFSGPRASGWPEAHDLTYQFTIRLINLVRGE